MSKKVVQLARIGGGGGGEVIWAMPERNRFFLAEVFPYPRIASCFQEKENVFWVNAMYYQGRENVFSENVSPALSSFITCYFRPHCLLYTDYLQRLIF